MENQANEDFVNLVLLARKVSMSDTANNWQKAVAGALVQTVYEALERQAVGASK